MAGIRRLTRERIMPRLPRILMVVTLPDWGGAQAYVHQLALACKGRYNVTVACGTPGPLIPLLVQADVPVIEIPSMGRNPHPVRDARALVHLGRILRRGRFDLVHLNSTKAGLIGRLAALFAEVPVVIFTAHGWAFGPARPRWQRLLLAGCERLTASLATKIICVSGYDRRLAEEFRVGRAGQLTVIRNGLDPAPYLSGGRDELRRQLAPGGERLTTMVARLAFPKDPFTVVEAWLRVGCGKLCLVGDGPLRPSLERRYAKELGDRLLLLGHRSDLPRILAASDLFVLASKQEGSPLAILEAMFAGRAVVASETGGIPELVQHGETGLVVPMGSVSALARALESLLQDDETRNRMGRRGRERALAHFSSERMIRETFSLYDGELGFP